MSALQTYLERLHADLSATPPPGAIQPMSTLSGARPDHLAIAVCTTDGDVSQVGTTHRFPLQSISKSFAYGAAIDRHGQDHVLSLVDEEPSGEEFNAISIDRETGRPKNPLINVGAIRVHAMLGVTGEERTQLLRAVLEGAAGRELEVHQETLREELASSDRNLALAYMLRATGSMQEDAQEVVAGYLEGCSILVTVEDLSVMAATLAGGGVNPRTGVRVFSRVTSRQVLSVMLTCGMYDNAGDWVSDVGLPAKSGVAGGIISALPARYGYATYSPQLDGHGNSVRGVTAFETLTEDFALHTLDGRPAYEMESRSAELLAQRG